LVAVLLVALVLGGAGGLWVAHDRRQQQDETEYGVRLALGKIEPLREQAQQIAPDDAGHAERALALWQQALAAVEHAEGLIAAGPDGVARWLSELPAALVEPVLVGLNEWSLSADPGNDRQRLEQVVERVDPDPWRRRLRQAVAQQDPAPLRALAVEAKGKPLS